MEIIASWPANAPLTGVAAWALRAEELGFDVMHVPETIHDPFTVAALALASTTTLTVRTSMVVAFPRSPMLTAYTAWDLANFSEGRFQLGLASQVRGNIVGRYSVEWSEPVARLRDYIRAVRAIFHCFQTGEELNYEGTHYTFTRLQPYFNPGPLTMPPPQIWTGGVNPKMCELAGEVSDGFVCHPTNSHPALLSTTILPALEAGIRAAGDRRAGPRIIAGPQPVMGATPAALAAVRDARRSELAFLYSTPAYRPQLELLGLGDLGDKLVAMSKASDWSHLASHLNDDVMDRVVPHGTFDEIPDVLDRWYSGLCDGIVLGVPADAADSTIRTLVDRCKAIATTRRRGG
ncbi:MAG: TIGR03617 family F420-dependent LLM class oxidoreductase [Propionibacteriales bacterium]|nr:TIGR03617 family F420-dependent LLM class oxidoreductase [Propionibacteriales bacterium]